jgi:hypothetical protein
MDTKSGEIRLGPAVDSPNVGNLGDGPNLLLDRLVRDDADKLLVVLGVDIKGNFGLEGVITEADRSY